MKEGKKKSFLRLPIGSNGNFSEKVMLPRKDKVSNELCKNKCGGSCMK